LGHHSGPDPYIWCSFLHPRYTNLPTPIPDPDTFAEQKQLVEAAIQLHMADRPLTVEAVCAEAGVEEAVVYTHVDDPAALLPAYYDLVVDQYHLLTGATADYDNFTFEERLASFYYIVLDTLGEQRAFVQATFDSSIRYNSSFRADVRTTLRSLLTDDRIPQTNQLVTGLWPVQEVLTEVTFAIIRHWIGDETEDQAATTALVDKLVAFVAELVTFGGVSTGVELAWHVVQHDALGLRRLPVVGWLFPKQENSPSN
jgi:AcrR family transcriptional regulator